MTMHFRRVALACALAALFASPAASIDRAYTTNGATCDGWPRAPIEMAKGMCAGIVIAPPSNFAKREIRLPRLLLPPDGRSWLVTDLGGWGTARGAVFKLTAERGKGASLTKLLGNLHMPHGLARGPDGKIYVGEMSRIFRFDPSAADPKATIETVVSGLPDNRLHENRHPLSYFIFDGNGDLLVNVGAPTDQCEVDGKPNGTEYCLESEGDEKTAGVRRYAYLGNGKWSSHFTMFGEGLRNSLALVRHASGTILQAENSIDFKTANEPFEEINVLREGAHYGWPYCYDRATPTPVWKGVKDCKSFEAPSRLLPPHAAPLGMLYYDGAMFPALKGKLLMTWHGYRPTGARLVAFDVDEKGVPRIDPKARYDVYGGASVAYPARAARALPLTVDWSKIPDLRPMGTPVGIAVASDGAIWLTEDKNATILRIATDKP